jgi:hypothetical protein
VIAVMRMLQQMIDGGSFFQPKLKMNKGQRNVSRISGTIMFHNLAVISFSWFSDVQLCLFFRSTKVMTI